MYRFEAATLPTNAGSGVTIASGSAPNERAARSGLERGLAHIAPSVASQVAAQAERVFTDFPEFGITVRVFESRF